MPTDSFVQTTTVAATSETLVARIHVPSNEKWLLKKIFCSHPSGGNYRLEVNSKGQTFLGKSRVKSYVMRGEFIQQLYPDYLQTGISKEMYDIDVPVSGPDIINIYTSNASAASGSAKVMCMYESIINRGRK